MCVYVMYVCVLWFVDIVGRGVCLLWRVSMGVSYVCDQSAGGHTMTLGTVGFLPPSLSSSLPFSFLPSFLDRLM